MSTCSSTHDLADVNRFASAVSRIDWRFCSAILLAAAIPLGLGLFRLGMPSLWFDEAATYLNVSSDWRWFWLTAISGEDCGGFVYGLLIKFWTSIFGYSEFALRAPGVLFAGLTSVVLLELGRRSASLQAGIMMALIGATHPLVIGWSRQARGYSLEILLTATYLLLIMAYAQRGGRARAVALTIVGSLLALTHIFGTFVIGGGTLFLILLRVRDSSIAGDGSLRKILAPTAVTGLLLGVWVFLMQARVKKNLDYFWIDGPITEKFWDVLCDLMPNFAATGFLVLAGFGVLLSSRRSPTERRLLLAAGCILTTVLAGPLAVSALSRGDHHFVFSRYFLPAVVPIAVVLGSFFAALPRRFGIPGALLCGASWATLPIQDCYSDYAYDGGRTRAAVQFLAERIQKRDQLFVTPKFEEATLLYYGIPSNAVRSAGRYRERDQLSDLLKASPPRPGARSWVLVYYCDETDDLRDLGLQDLPQERFGMIRLVCIEAKSIAPVKPATK